MSVDRYVIFVLLVIYEKVTYLENVTLGLLRISSVTANYPVVANLLIKHF